MSPLGIIWMRLVSPIKNMNGDRINALLNVLAGLLVFAAAAPNIVGMFRKAMALSDKERVIETFFRAMALILVASGILCYFFSVRFWGILLLFLHLVFAVTNFLRKPGPATRMEIFFDVVNPVFLFVFVFIGYYADDLLRHAGR